MRLGETMKKKRGEGCLYVKVKKKKRRGGLSVCQRERENKKV